jgi:hypothetical protein
LITDINSLSSHTANAATYAADLSVVVCTTGHDHLVPQLQLPLESFVHMETRSDPGLLGFECHRVLGDSMNSYDYFCYLEDDLILHDPWFFVKLAALTDKFGIHTVFQPHRYELPRRSSVRKAYIDGALSSSLLEPYRSIQVGPDYDFSFLDKTCRMRIADNPHAGCFFLNADQMRRWAQSPRFLDKDTSFVGPLESAATLGLLRHFAVYKSTAETANFLEIEHFGNMGSANIGPIISLPSNSKA